MDTNGNESSEARDWAAEKNRLVDEMVALDVSYAERKVDALRYETERARIVAEAEAAVKRLRAARAGNARQVAASFSASRAIGAAAVALVMISTGILSFALGGQDLRRDRSPHQPGGPIPLAAEEADPSQSGPQSPPDVRAMVASLEAKVQSGQGTLDQLLMLARSYRALGRDDESIATYRKAAAIAPADESVRMVLVSALVRSPKDADREEADQIVDAVLARDPSMPEALWFKSIGLVRRHEIPQARSVLLRLQPLVQTNAQARDAVAGLLAELAAERPPSSAPVSRE
jgi:cytochrome c-type biogenesis protein CcmH